MNKELITLEVSKQLKDFVLEFVKNGLDRRFIRGSFDIIETVLKVLDIIKEKGVNVGLLSRCANAERYNKGMCYESRYLTQEEYDLLKEVLI